MSHSEKSHFLRPCMSECMHGPACHKKILPKCKNHSKHFPCIESCIPTKCTKYMCSFILKKKSYSSIPVPLFDTWAWYSQFNKLEFAPNFTHSIVHVFNVSVCSPAKDLYQFLRQESSLSLYPMKCLCSVLSSRQIMSLQLCSSMKERVIDYVSLIDYMCVTHTQQDQLHEYPSNPIVMTYGSVQKRLQIGKNLVLEIMFSCHPILT